MINYRIAIFLVTACISIPTNLIAEYRISCNVFGNGGTVQTGAIHTVIGTVGQPLIGASSIVSCAGFWHINRQTVIPLSVMDELLPKQFILHGNYPNPFNPSTTVSFDMPYSSHVQFNVYSISGQRVATLLNNSLSPGQYSVMWKPSGVSSGVYLYSLEAGKKRLMGKMLYLK